MGSFFQILKFRIVWFAMLLAVLSIMHGYIGIFKLDLQTKMIIVCVIAACITVLRMVITQPIAEK